MVTVDCETCGFHGMAVTIQYAFDMGPIFIHDVWRVPVRETLELIEKICADDLLGFNLTFDFFHICKLYNVLSLSKDWEDWPQIAECAANESRARDGFCLKPRSALDLFLHAKKGPYQSLMDREDIRIKKVPRQLAPALAAKLEKLVEIKDVYFARKKDKYAKHWNCFDIEDAPEFQDVVLKFAPSSALKALCVDALGLDPNDVMLFSNISLPNDAHPEECGWAPFATAIAPRGPETGDWKGTWPEKIDRHITQWSYNTLARKYAEKDVELTRELWIKWGKPAFGDFDSNLACSVAAVRWKGFRIDVEKIKSLRDKAIKVAAETPTAPSAVQKWILSLLSETEQVIIDGCTDKVTLEAIEADDLEDCPVCSGNGKVCKDADDKGEPCNNCETRGKIHLNEFEPGRRAGLVLAARRADKEIELYDKLLQAGRFHASFKIIGTLSGRMAGSDKLNAQGIKSTDEVRSCFPLAWHGQVLTGGDFSGFEVVLADAVYADPDLHRDLTVPVTCGVCKGSKIINQKKCKTCKGKGEYVKKIHGIFGMELWPDMTYDEIVATAGTSDDRYSKAKRAVFLLLYGGMAEGMAEKLGLDLDVCIKAYEGFVRKYKKVGQERAKVFNMFCSMRQAGGIGSKVEWHDPCDYIESLFGFKRYFTLENKVAKALFELAENPPKDWLAMKFKVVRRDREQTATGATRSALFAAAFGIQAQAMRSAANHVIQSSGSKLTKELQEKIWRLQPVGISKWVVSLFQVHDEILCVCDEETVPEIISIKNQFIKDNLGVVPLLEVDWKERMTDWSSKH